MIAPEMPEQQEVPAETQDQNAEVQGDTGLLEQPIENPDGQGEEMEKPPQENDLHISKKSYKYPDKNEEGFFGFAKNGLFYGFPCCCCCWVCGKKEPETEKICDPEDEISDDDEIEKLKEEDHSQAYHQLPDGETRECFLCKKKVDEYFACNTCDRPKCLDCFKNPKKFGCLCIKIDPGKMEEEARAKAKESFGKMTAQTKEMFHDLRGEDKEEDQKEEHFKDLFSKFDTDGSGALKIVELKDFLGNHIREKFGDKLDAAVEKYEECSDEFWEKMYEELDTDGNGDITLEEFLLKIVDVLVKLQQFMFEHMKKGYKKLLEEIDKIDGE